MKKQGCGNKDGGKEGKRNIYLEHLTGATLWARLFNKCNSIREIIINPILKIQKLNLFEFKLFAHRTRWIAEDRFKSQPPKSVHMEMVWNNHYKNRSVCSKAPSTMETGQWGPAKHVEGIQDYGICCAEGSLYESWLNQTWGRRNGKIPWDSRCSPGLLKQYLWSPVKINQR